jgi:hypothetical protein
MLLREVTVENFRPFESASVRLPAEGLVLVAGANNSGKSALLSALDVVAGVGVDTQAWRRAGSASPARVAAIFTLSAEERSELFAVNPPRDELVAGGGASRLQLLFEDQPGGNLRLVSGAGRMARRRDPDIRNDGPARS